MPAASSSLATARSSARIQQVAVKYGIAAEVIGETAAERVEIKLDGRVVVSAAVSELREAYEGALEKALRDGTGCDGGGLEEIAELRSAGQVRHLRAAVRCSWSAES